MSFFLVTLKIPRNSEHDPQNKITGPCPVDPLTTCTDITGQHHTILVDALDIEVAKRMAISVTGINHITRVEGV